MGEVMGHSTARQSFNMLLLTIFGAVALLLAAIDIYGLMAYSVARLFIKMVFSSCAWVGGQQRMSAMAIVNLCLVQFGELSGVLLLIHFHLLGKFTRIVAVLSQKNLWQSISLRFERPGSPSPTDIGREAGRYG
jgi:hypothetical protein